ncbi:MAG TPA: T9SS type A sorting domain-containing protein [Bacteroidia bacterium]|jgi:hypothetical protein|nr:T9SS type A sorting domain-containing protein [Bacteroidia bacterium]
MKTSLTKRVFYSVLFFFCLGAVNAQTSTYTGVYNLLQAKCASCHNTSSPAGSLDLSGTASQVYANIVNHVPSNATAATRGDKLIKGGYVHSSFLLRKINNGLDADNGINAGEGSPCPQTGSVTNNDIELVRQWIIHGALQTDTMGTHVQNLIDKYYAGKSHTSVPASHPLPTDPGSYQLHIGKILLDSNSEMEYFMKYDLHLPDTIEVNRIELFMGAASHHFILYKFLSPSAATNFADGMRIQDPATGQGSSTGYSNIVSAWQRPYNFQLPAGTAYSWESGSVLDFNHHLYNYNPDSVLGMDIYLNIYTQPKHTAQHTMYSTLFYNPNILIPAGQTATFTQSKTFSSAANNWNVWFMSSHTHKYGVDFNIFQRNSDGTTGAQMYQGKFDYSHNTYAGSFDWAHPPVEIFTPMYVINPRDGFIAEATYDNTGSTPVQWGLTTKDEMMVYYIQYTLGDKINTGIQNNLAETLNLQIFPNPASRTTVYYTLAGSSKVKLEVSNLMGQNVRTLTEGEQSAGNYSFDIDQLAAGTYLLKTTVNGSSVTRKLIITN